MRQAKIIKNNNTLKEHTLIPTGSTEGVQNEDGGPLTYGSVTEHGNSSDPTKYE